MSANNSAFRLDDDHLVAGSGSDASGADASRLSENDSATKRACGVPWAAKNSSLRATEFAPRSPMPAQERDARASHLTPYNPRSPMLPRDVVGEEKRRLELLGPDLEPDLFVLLVQR